MSGIDPRRYADGGCWITFDPTDSTWDVCSTPVGPAGPAVLQLGSAGTLSVDWADCFRFTSLLLTHPRSGFASSPAETVVLRLLGRAAGERMLSVSGKVLLIEMDDAAVERCRSLCLLALLEHLRDDGGATGSGPSLWAAEAAVLRDASRIPGVEDVAGVEAVRGARALLDVDVAQLSGRARIRSAELASRLTPLVPRLETARRLEQLALRLLDVEPARDEPHAAEPEAANPPDVDLPVSLEKHGVDTGAGGRFEWSPETRVLTVTLGVRPGAVPLGADRVWARAFDSDGTLVSLAPFASDVLGTATTRLQLPSPLDPAHVTVDVTADPAHAAAAGRPGMIGRAAELGRHATEAERLGLTGRAARLWAACARAWEQIDDPDRAALASKYAGAARPGAASPPAERVVDLAAPPTWAETYLDAAREVPPPFLAEIAESRF